MHDHVGHSSRVAFPEAMFVGLGNVVPGAQPGFYQGGGLNRNFRKYWPVGCENSTKRKLFAILQASSLLPHSKILKHISQSSKSRNLTKVTLRI